MTHAPRQMPTSVHVAVVRKFSAAKYAVEDHLGLVDATFEGAVEYVRAASAPCEPKAHRWDSDGERCLDCGDKDWMSAPVCVQRERPPQESVNVEALVTDVCMMIPTPYKAHTPSFIQQMQEREDVVRWIAATHNISKKEIKND